MTDDNSVKIEKRSEIEADEWEGGYDFRVNWGDDVLTYAPTEEECQALIDRMPIAAGKYRQIERRADFPADEWKSPSVDYRVNWGDGIFTYAPTEKECRELIDKTPAGTLGAIHWARALHVSGDRPPTNESEKSYRPDVLIGMLVESACAIAQINHRSLTMVGQMHAENSRLVEVARRADALAAEIERLERLIYVPGAWRCAKCGCGLVSTNVRADTGTFSANSSPHDCPNGCGPMWRVTEREAGNRLSDSIDKIAEERAEGWSLVETLAESLRDYGDGWSEDDVTKLRQRAADFLPDGRRPEWLEKYRGQRAKAEAAEPS